MLKMEELFSAWNRAGSVAIICEDKDSVPSTARSGPGIKLPLGIPTGLALNRPCLIRPPV